MFIEYSGHSCFYLKGKDFSVVTDPFSGIGLSLTKFDCDYVLVSHGHFDHNNVSGVNAKKAIYSQEGIFRAIPCYHDEARGLKRGSNLAFYFEIDGLNVLHLGDLGEPFDKNNAEKFSLPVDVLFIPVGGKYTIDAEEAEKYVQFINAKVAIIMHYKTDGNTVDIAPPDKFLALHSDYKRVKNGVEITKDNISSFPSVIMIDS